MKQIIPFSKDIVFKTNIASITSISLEHEEKISDGEVTGDFIIFGDYKIHNDTTEKEMFKYKVPFTTLIPDNIDKTTVNIDINNFTYEQVESDVVRVNIDFSVEGEELVEEKEEALEQREESNIDSIEMLEEIEEKLEQPPLEVEMLGEYDDSQLDIIDKEIDEILERNADINDIVEDVDNQEKISPVEEKVDEILENERDEILADEQAEEIQETQEIQEVQNVQEVEKKVREEKIMESDDKKDIKKEADSEYVTYHIHILKEEETLESVIKMYGGSIDIVKEYNELSDIKVGQKIIIPEYLDE